MSEYIFKLPDLGEGTVESEIGEWNVAVGDLVEEDAVIGTMMTDKAAVELNSPVTGTVLKLAGEPGDMIAVGSPLIVFETDGESESRRDAAPTSTAPPGSAPPDSPASSAAAAVGAASRRDSTSPAGHNGKVMTSPAIRRRAKEAGIDLSAISGSGAGGRILRKDFDAYIKGQGTAAPVRKPAAAAPADQEVKVIGLRRMIAERMTEANREVPHFSYVEEMDITELESLRQHLNSRKADKADRLTLLPFLGMALIRALRQFPQCNTTYDKNRNVLLRHGAVHLGVATQTPDGLKVPVVRNASQLRLDELAAEIRRVTEAARNNTAKKDELSGSTITITSLGKLGGIVSTPVINLPEVSIIGVNRAVERPVVVDGQIAVRLMMNLSSSFDHRFVDGYDAAAMIQEIREMLEHPATIFID
jgi:2-oxoisovalerate dehydrogenase E2 component (dihydrolipoyl transacylase)